MTLLQIIQPHHHQEFLTRAYRKTLIKPMKSMNKTRYSQNKIKLWVLQIKHHLKMIQIYKESKIRIICIKQIKLNKLQI
jgi:hypothetical protein